MVNLILAIVSMSYLEQQKKVEGETEERERRKIDDELQLKNEEEEEQKLSAVDILLHMIIHFSFCSRFLHVNLMK